MALLSNLSEKIRTKTRRRVGRGTGCKKGKTSGRGHKGDKSRSGYKRRHGQEGGQLPLFRKLPVRGFSNARFKKIYVSVNFSKIDFLYNDGETVSLKTLSEKGFAVPARAVGVKVLSGGELKKKVKIEAMAYSKSAAEKLKELSIEHKTV